MDYSDCSCQSEAADEGSSTCSSFSGCRESGNCCCCCSYDPFDDDSPESQIRDLSFALRKLAVMKCQMRKWRLERLELESQARKLKRALQSCGLEPNEVLKPDPVLVHLRTENVKLQRCKEELEDRVRDLSESLAERVSVEEQPSDALIYLEEKMLAVRHRCAIEKRQMRETIASLRVKLHEAQDEGSCSALNRLRAKLRELMSERQRGEGDDGADPLATLALERSIETMGELSRSCDDLKKENERLLAEVEALKREIKEDNQSKFVAEQSLLKGSEDIEELMCRVRNCETEVNKLRCQLVEKDACIQELQAKLFDERDKLACSVEKIEQMAIVQRASIDKIENMKIELRDKNEKITDLINEVRRSSEMLMNTNELENELEMMRPSMNALSNQHENLKAAHTRISQQLATKNEEVQVMQQKYEAELNDFKLKLATQGSKYEEEIASYKKQLDEQQRKNEEEISNVKKQLSEQQSKGESEINKLKQQIDELKNKCESEKQDLKNKYENQLAEQEHKLDEETNNLKQQLEELQRKFQECDRERAGIADLQKTIDSLTKEKNDALQKLADERKAAAEANNALKDAIKNLEEQLKDAKMDAQCLRDISENLKAKGEGVENERDKFKKMVDELTKKKDQLENELGNFKWQLDKLKKEQKDCQDELEKRKEAIKQLEKEKDSVAAGLQSAQGRSYNSGKLPRGKSIDFANDELERLRKQLEDCVAENDRLGKLTGSGGAESQQLQASREDKTTQFEQARDAKPKFPKIMEPSRSIKRSELGSECMEHIADMSCALKQEMQKQIHALDQVREYINYAEGKVTTKPKLITDLGASTRTDWKAPEINELFKTSKLLSCAIVKTEEELEGLENLMKNKQGRGPTSQHSLANYQGKSSQSLQQTGSCQQIASSGDTAQQGNGTCDPYSWLNGLSLKELAELHNRVCQMTSGAVRRTGVTDDSCKCETPGDKNQQLDAKMAALQRRIVEKQREAACRANEMHRALLVEQARLIRLSDDVNRERELNLALRLTVEAGTIPGAAAGAGNCCDRADCGRAGCCEDC